METVEILLKYSTAYPFRLKGVNKIVCAYCLDEFIEPDEFREHVDDEHEHVKVSNAFNHTKSIEYVKVDCTNLRCRVCSAQFATMEEVAQHLFEEHDFTTLNLDYQIAVHPHKLEKDNWLCFVCNKKFPSIYNLWKHTPTHYSQHTCEFCGRNYVSRRSMTYHIRYAHSNTYKCGKCWQEFRTKEERYFHMKSSESCRPFGCTSCGARFPTNDQKEKHREERHGQARTTYRCPECRLTFDKRSHFYNHYSVKHASVHSCTWCDELFPSKSSLKVHVNTHTNEDIYKCDICGKEYSMKRRLSDHMRCHNRKKKQKFLCVVCGKTFIKAVTLQSHLKSRHPGVEIYDESE